MNDNIKEFSCTYFLTAGECNPSKEMPLSLVVSRLIEVATIHANSWGAGYAKLVGDDQCWVLSRVTVEMKRYPKVNEEYTFVTWIEDYNRYFSQRNFAILDYNGEEIGYLRTIWVVINNSTRDMVAISKLSYICDKISKRLCPIEPQSRLGRVDGREGFYKFRYTDTDINRHVNSVKYVELLMNQWDFHFYDKYMIKRFEIAYIKECLYGMEAKVAVDDGADGLDAHLEISTKVNDVETIHCRGRLVFEERE